MLCRRMSMDNRAKYSIDVMHSSDSKSSLGLSFLKSKSLPNLRYNSRGFYDASSEVEMPHHVCQFDQSKQTGAGKPSTEVTGTFCQISECLIEMELLVLPMISDRSRKDLRLPASNINAEKRNILKKIAANNDLVMLNIGKGKSAVIVLRKKAALLQRQAAEMEILSRAAQERQVTLEEKKLKLCEEEEACHIPEVKQMSTSTSIQSDESDVITPKELSVMTTTSVSTGHSESSTMNSAARRKARREAVARELAAVALAKSRMVESTMQTCPLDYLLCPWCTMEIPPEAQCGHVDICLAGLKQQARQAKVEAQLAQHRLAVENSRRRKLGLAPLKQVAFKSKQNQIPISSSRNNREASRSPYRRSRSRTHSVDLKQSAASKRLAAVAAQLEPVHPNDVDGMLHASQRICAHVDCAHLIGASGGACSHCKMVLCPQHRPAHTGHKCKSAPLPKQPDASCEGNHHKMDMACGEDIDERQFALRSRLKEKLRNFADKRQR